MLSNVAVANPTYTLKEGDAREILPALQKSSFDSLVTDPPAGIGFGGHAWDDDLGAPQAWIEWLQEILTAALLTLKPGAYGLIWTLPRTAHRTACAAEAAGFRIVDRVVHLFGQGWARSLDVNAEIAKTLERGHAAAPAWWTDRPTVSLGTTLKPGHEDWLLVQRPREERTVAAQVLATGTGALRLDKHPASDGRVRVPSNVILSHAAQCEKANQVGTGLAGVGDRFENRCAPGCPVAALGRQSAYFPVIHPTEPQSLLGEDPDEVMFLYAARPSSREREAGCDQLPKRPGGSNRKGYTSDVARGLNRNAPRHNHHPSVKSVALMRRLCRMVTPVGGTVLDPFAGSGSTGRAAMIEGLSFFGIEADPEYAAIARARIQDSRISGLTPP